MIITYIRGLIEAHRLKKREDKVLKDCGCFCRCPKCKDILNDQAECTDTDLVRYICGCGHKSEWNFDIAPVPILMKGQVNE